MKLFRQAEKWLKQTLDPSPAQTPTGIFHPQTDLSPIEKDPFNSALWIQQYEAEKAAHPESWTADKETLLQQFRETHADEKLMGIPDSPKDVWTLAGHYEEFRKLHPELWTRQMEERLHGYKHSAVELAAGTELSDAQIDRMLRQTKHLTGAEQIQKQFEFIRSLKKEEANVPEWQLERQKWKLLDPPRKESEKLAAAIEELSDAIADSRETGRGQSSACDTDPISQLERLAELKAKGILTEEEFLIQKQRVLA